METILELLKPIADGILDHFGSVLARLINEPSYLDGFLGCISVLVVFGLVSRAVAYALALVKKFFSASKGPPAPGAGPAPVDVSSGCAQGVVILFVFAVVALFLLYRLVSR